MWRKRWEATHGDEWKDRLVTYNREDCAALRRVTEFLHAQGPGASTGSGATPAAAGGPPVAPVEEIDRLGAPRRWGVIAFVHADYQFVNGCARFDYQRQRVFLPGLLKDFRGVLVSDFYAAYDALPCPQQKCLIHLIRDMNQDLLNHPFDAELQSITAPFGTLLREAVEEVDRHGLKARYLGRHERAAARFFDDLARAGGRTRRPAFGAARPGCESVTLPRIGCCSKDR